MAPRNSMLLRRGVYRIPVTSPVVLRLLCSMLYLNRRCVCLRGEAFLPSSTLLRYIVCRVWVSEIKIKQSFRGFLLRSAFWVINVEAHITVRTVHIAGCQEQKCLAIFYRLELLSYSFFRGQYNIFTWDLKQPETGDSRRSGTTVQQ